MDTDPSKKISWTTAILIFFIVGLLTAGLSVFVQARNRTILPTAPSSIVAVITTGTTTSVAAAQGLGSSFEVPGAPVRLIIPSIGVDAAVQSVGLAWAPQNKGDIGTPSNFTDVAWYNGGPLPGMPGSAVIDGHFDGKTVQQAVFYNLGALRAGDIVQILDTAGKTWQFAVVTSTMYDYNATTSDIFSSDASTSRLNLITCAGDWDTGKNIYNKRIVVFTELVVGR